MNKKLYVGNLPFTAEEAQLQALFGSDGRQVSSVTILSDKVTGRSRGFGFVEMSNADDAQRAIEALSGHEFMGRPLIVNEAREQTPRSGSGFGRGGGGDRNSGGGFGGRSGGGFGGGSGGGRGNSGRGGRY